MAMCGVTFHSDLGLRTFYSAFQRRGRRLDRTAPFQLLAADRTREGITRLLVPQRNHRIDLSRSARRYITSDKSNAQNSIDDAEDGGVGTDAESQDNHG